jgi:hypothetical protein
MVTPSIHKQKHTPSLGCLVSRKFNGWYVIWNGFDNTLYTPNKTFHFNPPAYFHKYLPLKVKVHGELVLLDSNGKDHNSILSITLDDNLWKYVEFHIFSVVSENGKHHIPTSSNINICNYSDVEYTRGNFVYIIKQHKMVSKKCISAYYTTISDNKSEGIVISITKPNGLIINRYKVRSRWIGVAIIKNINSKGITVYEEFNEYKLFNIYFGFTKIELESMMLHFKVGDTVSFSYSVRHINQTPSFPRYARDKV